MGSVSLEVATFVPLLLRMYTPENKTLRQLAIAVRPVTAMRIQVEAKELGGRTGILLVLDQLESDGLEKKLYLRF